jgi:hypothetical protein
MEAKSIDLSYLNRAGRLVLRPERNGSEIGLPDVSRMRIAGVAEFATTTTVSESCISILSNIFLKLLEIITLRLYGRLIRHLFLGLGDSTISIALFLDFIIFFPRLFGLRMLRLRFGRAFLTLRGFYCFLYSLSLSCSLTFSLFLSVTAASQLHKAISMVMAHTRIDVLVF